MTAPSFALDPAMNDPTRDRSQWDGVLTPGNAQPESEDALPPAEPRGALLDETDPATLYRLLEYDWVRTERMAKNALERDKRNMLWVEGFRGVRLVQKDQDRGTLQVHVPLGMSNAPPTPNHLNDLRRKTVAQLIVDPASPLVEPETGTDAARAASLLGTRFLTSDGQEGGTDDVRLFREALDYASIVRSSYIYHEIHPSAGGHRPLQLQAHPQAQDPNQPLQGPPPPVGPDGLPMPSLGPEPAPVLRYVTPPHPETGQRQFTENPAEAETQWLPKAVAQILSPQNVRLFPDSATCDAEATGLRMCFAMPLEEWKARYEDPSNPWSDEVCKALCQWKPMRWQALISRTLWQRIQMVPDGKRPDHVETPPESMVFAYVAYERARPAYPKGACVVVSGAEGGTILHQGEWTGLIDRPDGTQLAETLELPVTMVRPLADPARQDPLGMAMVELYGWGDETLARITGSVIEWMWKALHPHAFVTSPVSAVTQNSYARRDDRLLVLGSPDEKVSYEQLPQLPSGVYELISMIKKDMDTSAGLEKPAQGGAASDVRSAQQARMLIEQSLVSMAEMFQAYRHAIIRFWRIKLQQARCFITLDLLASYMGDDAVEDVKYWTGADLLGAKTVRIADGTGTMLPPTQKQEWLTSMQQNQWVTADDAAQAARLNAAPMLALQEDTQRTRIDREIAKWREGPPPNWQPGMQMQDPMTGQVTQRPPTSNPFTQTIADSDPGVAKIRRSALIRLMGESVYLNAQPAWRQLADQAYLSATQALQAAQMAAQSPQGASPQQGQSTHGPPDQPHPPRPATPTTGQGPAGTHAASPLTGPGSPGAHANVRAA